MRARVNSERPATDREALAVARDSRVVQAIERAATALERAWQTSAVHRAARTPLAAFQALSPREQISVGAVAIVAAALTHLVLRLL